MVFYPKKKKKNLHGRVINKSKKFIQDIDSLISIRLVGNKYEFPKLWDAKNREKYNTKQSHDTKNYVV